MSKEQRPLETQLNRLKAGLLKERAAREKLEEQLRQAQMLEGIGALVGGIAHHVNNIFTVTHGYTALLIESDADAQIRGVVTLLKQTLPKNIDIEVEANLSLPPVIADANQIHQALLNLCINARDAMPTGGTPTIRTDVVDRKNLRDAREAGAARYVCIEIRDTGFGMDESVRSRIFEPFFTTKGIGEGRGLGLPVVDAIVKSHNGFIQVESQPGVGSAFRLYLPVLPSLEETPALNEAQKKTCPRHPITQDAELSFWRKTKKACLGC